MTILAHPFIPMPDDGLVTVTSEEQQTTEESISDLILPFRPIKTPSGDILPADQGLDSITLTLQDHINFLRQFLHELPSRFTGLDSSRPWIVFWVCHSLALLGTQLLPQERSNAVNFLFRCSPTQPPSAFGGGPDQLGHLATTYASIMALAYVATTEDWKKLDRRALLKWMLSLKQADGSFIMHHGGEVDVRGCYCALSVAYLCGIATPELVENTASFVASCQTYEGGFASASHPSPGMISRQLGEAHGGYTFCAWASYCALELSGQAGEDSTDFPFKAKAVDVQRLYRWASHMQGLPIEGGGFRGRSNKLVDGCYSWWNGALFQLIDAFLFQSLKEKHRETDSDNDSDVTKRPSLFDRDALQEYVLLVGQNPDGGLRDKPGKSSDAYHSCYNLSGLSAAQHPAHYYPDRARSLFEATEDGQYNGIEIIKGDNETDEQAKRRLNKSYAALMSWDFEDEEERSLGKRQNRIERTHPILNVEISTASDVLGYFYGKGIRENTE